jgi:hypothetical protein
MWLGFTAVCGFLGVTLMIFGFCAALWERVKGFWARVKGFSATQGQNLLTQT